MPFGSMMYVRWYADNLWLFVPVGEQVKQFIGSIQDYPFQEGGGMNPSGINYKTLKAAGAQRVVLGCFARVLDEALEAD